MRKAEITRLYKIGEALGGWYTEKLSYPATLMELEGFAMIELPKDIFSGSNRQNCDGKGGWCYSRQTGSVYPNHSGLDHFQNTWQQYGRTTDLARHKAIKERRRWGKFKDNFFWVAVHPGKLLVYNQGQYTEIDLDGEKLLTFELRDLNADGRDEILYTIDAGQGRSAVKRPLVWDGLKVVNGRHWRSNPADLTPGF